MVTIEAVGIRRLDPLLRDLVMPFTATFHPAGFPLRLATNSRDVMEAAAESWDQWSPEFATDPVEMRVLVEPEGDLAGAPRFRMQGHLIHAVSDRDSSPRSVGVEVSPAMVETTIGKKLISATMTISMARI